MREFASGATRDDDAEKLDYEGFLSPLVLSRFARYMHKHRFQADGKVRDSDNWQKGIPREAYMKSLFRHFMDTWLIWRNHNPLGEIWEDVLCAMLFNIQGLLHESIKLSEGSMGSEVPYPGSIRELDGLGRICNVEGVPLSPEELVAFKRQTSYSLSGGRLVSGEVKK